MGFTLYEKNVIEKYVSENETTLEKLSDYLDEDAYNFLKAENNLRTIHDDLLFIKTNLYRPYDILRVTKFLTPEFKIKLFFEDIIGQLTPPYFCFIDFHFLALCKSREPEKQKSNQMDFKLQKASKASAINLAIKIFSSSIYNDLTKEFENKDTNDLLNDAFLHHSELYEFEGSGLIPYQLLSMVVHIQKFKPNFF
jgi:hypothetical protein